MIKLPAELPPEVAVFARLAGVSMSSLNATVVRPPATREQEVAAGRADAFMTDYPYSRRMVDLTDWARVIAPPAVFHQTDYAYALAPGDDSLLQRVNAYIRAIKKDGRLLIAARKHQLDPIVVKD